MEGNRLSFDEASSKSYHGRRRNATVGNLRFNRNSLYGQDSASNASSCKISYIIKKAC